MPYVGGQAKVNSGIYLEVKALHDMLNQPANVKDSLARRQGFNSNRTNQRITTRPPRLTAICETQWLTYLGYHTSITCLYEHHCWSYYGDRQ